MYDKKKLKSVTSQITVVWTVPTDLTCILTYCTVGVFTRDIVPHKIVVTPILYTAVDLAVCEHETVWFIRSKVLVRHCHGNTRTQAPDEGYCTVRANTSLTRDKPSRPW